MFPGKNPQSYYFAYFTYTDPKITISKATELSYASSNGLKCYPSQCTHKELESLPLADRDYPIQDLVGDKNHLQVFCELRNNHLNNNDFYGIWESNLPIYFLPSVNVFPEIIHLCCKNYQPTQRAVKTPLGTILFHITPDSINQMLNLKPTQLLFPLTMKFLLDEGPKLSSSEIT